MRELFCQERRLVVEERSARLSRSHSTQTRAMHRMRTEAFTENGNESVLQCRFTKTLCNFFSCSCVRRERRTAEADGETERQRDRA